MGIIIFPIRPRINDLVIIINIPDNHKKNFDFVRFGGGQDITIQLDCTQAVTADIERRIFCGKSWKAAKKDGIEENSTIYHIFNCFYSSIHVFAI